MGERFIVRAGFGSRETTCSFYLLKVCCPRNVDFVVMWKLRDCISLFGNILIRGKGGAIAIDGQLSCENFFLYRYAVLYVWLFFVVIGFAIAF